MSRKNSICFIVVMVLVTLILGGLYFCIEKSTESIDKDKWQNLLVSIEGFALAILLGLYTARRMDKAEETRKEQERWRIEDNEKQDKLRREDNTKQEKLRIEDNARQDRLRIEDKLTERYAEALRNLYNTEREDLQLLGIRELYNAYQ